MMKIRNALIVAIVLVSALVAYNQFQITSVRAELQDLGLGPAKKIADVNAASLMSTAQTVKAVFPGLKDGMSEQEIAGVLLPTGTPSYSAALGGISYEQPEKSLEYLSKWYPTIKAQVEENQPDVWARYKTLASGPRGISCEFCCGVGEAGADVNGNLACGCDHNIALQALTLGLLSKTNMNDAQVLHEAMLWKTLFFPKDMVALGTRVAGTDASQIVGLPSQVGGC